MQLEELSETLVNVHFISLMGFAFHLKSLLLWKDLKYHIKTLSNLL